ncbi:MAG: MaoC/PaaZ C-terminal domain-containing protein [Nocardioides alkalitolerans]
MRPPAAPAVTAEAVGDDLPDLAVTVRAEAMKPTALLLRDPNPIHLDPAVVRGLGLGDRVINQGPLNVGYLWEMLARWTGDAGLVRSLDVRFTSNAFAGEVLVAGGVIEDVADADGERLATCSVWLCAEDGRDVVRGTARVGLPRRTTPDDGGDPR